MCQILFWKASPGSDLEFGLSGGRDGRPREWLASITEIYVKDDWKWNKPIETDVERFSKSEMCVKA